MISTYFFLKILSDVFDCFGLLFWSRSCLKSSGRLLGTISTKFRPNPRSWASTNHSTKHVLLRFVLTVWTLVLVVLVVVLVVLGVVLE